MNQDISKQAKEVFESGNFIEAAKLFGSAQKEYQVNGDRLMAAEMANNCSVARLKAGDGHGALEAALNTEEVFAEAGDLHRQALALGNQAAAYEALGKIKLAIEKYQISADLLKQTGDKELRSYVLKNLSALQLRSGDQLQAMATMEAALDNQKKLSFKERFLKKLLRLPFKLMH